MLDFLKWLLIGVCAAGGEGAGFYDDVQNGGVLVFDGWFAGELYGYGYGFSVELGDGDGSENFRCIRDLCLSVFHNAAHLSDFSAALITFGATIVPRGGMGVGDCECRGWFVFGQGGVLKMCEKLAGWGFGWVYYRTVG